MRRSTVWISVLSLLLLLSACGRGGITSTPEADLASLSVDERYIVVMRDAPMPAGASAARADAVAFARGLGLAPERAYGAALVGFSARMTQQRAAALARNPRVAYVEPDLRVQLFVQTVPTGIDRSFASTNDNLGIDGSDDVRVDVDVAVLDTGIDVEHPDLNVVRGVDCTVASGGGPPWARTYTCDAHGTGGDDDHYHGTHVAGTIAALDNAIGVVGVAPGARLHAVKVLDAQGSGYTSGIIDGIDWVVRQGDIEVLNMSLGGEGISTAYRDAIDEAVRNGVVVVVAAGNSGADANNYSPAFVPSAITVSALADFDGAPGGSGSPTCRTDQDDTLADFSNWGTAVDIAAPGVCILSTYPIEQGEYATISGTSMAAPHVAGAAALLASGPNGPQNGTDVRAIRDKLVNNGNFDWTDDSGDGVPEPLLDLSDTGVFAPTLVDSGSGSGGGGGENATPTAAFDVSIDGLQVTLQDRSDDTDGSIVSWAWDFGDDATSTEPNPVHTYASEGTYKVALTVTDDAGATAATTETVTVTLPSSGEIVLDVQVKGRKWIDLSWAGSSDATVDVLRDGALLAVVANDGSYRDSTADAGPGPAEYQVCGATSGVCSNIATATW